jgi:predicted MFS family arabinose efflux permease
VAVGVLFGSVEVAVPAVDESLSGPLMGLWGLGSLLGGVVATRRGGGAHSPAGLALVLAFLAAGHLALVGATGSLPVLAAMLFLAGTGIAPTFASVYAMVDRVAPAGTVTEAFAWLTTAVAVGTSAGAAVSGTLVEGFGPSASFVLAGAAGAVALLAIVLRARTLEDRPALGILTCAAAA